MDGTAQPDPDWPPGPGEMARLVREHDWAATPLGPRDAWPDRFAGAVERMLETPLVASLAYGPERMLLYNDAAAALYDDRHPGALGRPIPETWPEACAGTAHLYDRAFAGEALRVPAQPVDVSRAGGEAFDLALTPVRDAAGAVAAVLMVGFEVGARLRAEAALRETQDRQAFLLSLSDALRPLGDPVAITEAATRLLGERLGTSRAYYAEWPPGADHAEIAHDYAAPGLPSLAARYPIEAFRTAYDRVSTGTTWIVEDNATAEGIGDAERAHHQGAGVIAWVDVPLIKDGLPRAVLCVVQDEPRRWMEAEVALVEEVAERLWAAVERGRAEGKLRDSEEKFRSLFERMDQGFCVVERIEGGPGEPVDFRYVLANPAFERHTGLRHPVGHTIRELVPEPEPSVMAAYDRVARTGRAERFEAYVRPLDLWMDAEVVPAEGPGRIAVLFSNVSERKRAEASLRASEERQAFLLRLSDALRPLGDPAEIEGEACRLLGERLGVDHAHYARIDEAKGRAPVARDYVRGDRPSLAAEYALGDFGWIVPLSRTGRATAVADAPTSPVLPDGDQAAMEAIGVACIAVAPLVKDGAWVGALVVTQIEPRRWTDFEIRLLEETGERIWASIERARAEGALRRSEERLQLALDAAGMGTFVWHVAEDRTEEDARARALIGLAPDGTVTLAGALATILHPDDAPRYAAAVARAVDPAGPGTLHEEFRIRRPDGQERWTSVSATAQFEGQPPVAARLAGVLADVTDRKRAEARLRDSEERFRAIVETARDHAIFTTDPEGRIEAWPPGAQEVFGWAAEDAVGRMVDMTFTPEDRAAGAPEEERRMAREDGQAPNVRWHLRRDGARVFIDGVTRPLRGTGGALTGFVKVGQDVTERQATEDALRESELRFRTLSEGIPQLVWTAVDYGSWTWASPRWTPSRASPRGTATAGAGWEPCTPTTTRPRARPGSAPRPPARSRPTTACARRPRASSADSRPAPRPSATRTARSSNGWAPAPTCRTCARCRNARACWWPSSSTVPATSWAWCAWSPTRPSRARARCPTSKRASATAWAPSRG